MLWMPWPPLSLMRDGLCQVVAMTALEVLVAQVGVSVGAVIEPHLLVVVVILARDEVALGLVVMAVAVLRALTCYNCGQAGHKAMAYQSQGPTNLAAELPSTFAVFEEGQAAFAAAEAGAWVVDSGCTTHMARSAEGLTNVRHVM